MGQFPMNFSDVKPDFTLQVPNNSGNVSSTSGTRKVGYPFHQNVGILTPRLPQQNIPYNPGPQQPYVNIFSIIFDNSKFTKIYNICSNWLPLKGRCFQQIESKILISHT